MTITRQHAVAGCRFVILLMTAVIAQLPAMHVYAQGSTTVSLIGTVVDSAGGVIAGATVVVKKTGTGVSFNTVTSVDGAFVVPGIEVGTYSVTVSREGFKTSVINDVRVAPGGTAVVKTTLEVGRLSEHIIVEGGAESIDTQRATIAATLNVDQINTMPMPTRDAINAVTFLPGVNTPGINRNSNVNGLPDSFVAISFDGVNNNENFNKSSEGLFAMVTPRQDAVAAVTVTTAVGGADIGGHGAVQISFVTRSGTNRFTGSAYEYHRSPTLNTNYFFNEIVGLAKNNVVLNQFGFRQGGPIVIPKLYDGRGKAFFFVNYEELRLRNDFTRTRTILAAEAEAGLFRYNVTVAGQSETRAVDVMALAARTGQITTVDALVMRTLGYIRGATRTMGATHLTTDPNLLQYVWLSPGEQIEKQPVVRIDYNVGAKHRLSATYNWQVVTRDPDHPGGGDIRFPGGLNYSTYVSYRPLTAGTLRSTLTPNLANELKGGMRWGPSYFGRPSSSGPQTYADMDGFALDLSDNDLDITNWHTQNNPRSRSAWSWNIDNTLNWHRGKHSLGFGAALYFGNVWVRNQQMVPTITFGVDPNDPAASLFSTANFPGASTSQLADARDLYALLTGRVTSVRAVATLDPKTNEYVYLGAGIREGTMNEYSLFAQDSWRVTPTITVNAGLRWDIQMPFSAANNTLSQASYEDACGVSGIGPDGVCGFFQPGATGGKTPPTFTPFKRGSPGYPTDWNNVAPNVGIAWRPNIHNGWMRSIFGSPDQATVRAGYSIAYDRQGLEEFTSQYGANPGRQLSVTHSGGNGLLVPPGDAWPVLLSQRERLTTAPFPAMPTYPISARPNRLDDLNIFHPNIKVAFARSYTVGFQRALSRNTAFEIRYVGTRGEKQWTEENYNEINIIENGFFEEFQRAMANLQANLAAGRGGTFAFTGVAGTSPLPIYLAYFNGSNQPNNPSAYTGTNWTNETFVGRLARQNPNPAAAASDLDGNQIRRANALAAGMSSNLFVLNPDVSSVNVYESAAYSNYNALQIELRRRLSRELQINGSYQYARSAGSVNLGRHFGRVLNPTGNVRHAFKTQWHWGLPVGRGRRYGTNMPRMLDSIAGGWEFSGAGRIQARVVNFGNVRLVGMTANDLSREYKYRVNRETRIVTMLPDDIILNTRRAFNVSATSATGYSELGVPEGRYLASANSADCIQLKSGDCAPRTLLVRAPFFTRFDIGLTKRFAWNKQMNFQVRLDLLNVFDNINFTPVANPGPGATIFQVGAAYRDLNNTFDPGGRLGQLVFRVNW